MFGCIKSFLIFLYFQFVSEHVVRYSVYSGQDENGLTSYVVHVEVLVGGPNNQGGVSQEPDGSNQGGPGPQDPPSGQQGLLIPVPEVVNGANGIGHDGSGDEGSAHSSVSPSAEVLVTPPVPSGVYLRSPLADLNGRTPPAPRASTIVPEDPSSQENPTAVGPPPHLC